MYYSRKQKQMKALIILAAVILMACAGVWFITAQGGETAWDAEFPMPNAHISWEQTYYSGAWR